MTDVWMLLADVVLMATSFVFPDLKYLNTLWLYLMGIMSLGN